VNRTPLGIGMTSRRTRERMAERLVAAGIAQPQVLEAMRTVPRHLFVDEALATRAYEDTALPIGFGQTISQPYVVARMSELLLAEGSGTGQVLEVGSGCGYQSAILAALFDQVFAIERVGALVRRARNHLHTAGVRNVRLRHGDGMAGWEANAPYAAILAAAAPQTVPEALLRQLAQGGRLVMPVVEGGQQRLIRIVREGDSWHQELLEPVSFVPMLAGMER